MSPTFRSLRHRNYRLYWSGMFVSNVGTWMQRVAQDWLVLVVLGAGPAALGITTGLQFLPFLLVAPLGGLIADRFPKRRVLQITNAFLGLLGLTMGVLVLTGTVQVWHVYVLAFLLGVGAALDNPSRQAYVSELVAKDELTNAVALNSASFNAARLVGPALAGILIGVIGPGWVFVVNAASFAAPIVALVLLRRMAVPALAAGVRGVGALQRLGDGVRYVRARPDLLMVMAIMFFVGTFGMNFQMTSALMATMVFEKGSTEYGILGSILAIGTLSGALIAARRGVPRRRLIVLGAIAFGVLEIVAGLMPNYTLFAVSIVPMGVAAMTVLTAANVYIQSTVPQQMRGRVMSLYMMVLMGGTPVGAPLIGWVAQLLGPRWSLLGGGGLTIIGAVVITLAMARSNGFVLRVHVRPRPHLSVRSATPAPASTYGSPDASGPAEVVHQVGAAGRGPAEQPARSSGTPPSGTPSPGAPPSGAPSPGCASASKQPRRILGSARAHLPGPRRRRSATRR